MNRPLAPLDPHQREQLVARIAQELTTAVPPGWRRLWLEYRGMGRHVEVDFVVTGADGTPGPVPPPPQAVELLGRLRAGMHQPGRGTWLGAAFAVDPGHAPHVEYLHDREPQWRHRPPPVGYQDELRFFPRAEENVPEWLGRQAAPSHPSASALETNTDTDSAVHPVAGTSPDEEEPHTPRVFDALDDSGMPIVERTPLESGERERVLDYLGVAPVVLAARSYDADRFDPERPSAVPLTFRTDGTWVWPGAVAYYLREHDVAPDPAFLAHIRARRYTVPEVGESARERAVATVTGESAVPN